MKKKDIINILLRLEHKDAVLAMTDEEAGHLMKAIYNYGADGVVPDKSDRTLFMTFQFFKKDIDDDRQAFKERCRINSENASKAHAKKVKANGCDRNPSATYNNKYNSNNGEINSPPLISENECDDPQYSFERIWELYGKPVGNIEEMKALWKRLTLDEKKAIFDYVPLYTRARPQIQFRKNFDRFITCRTWENEPIANTNTIIINEENDTRNLTSCLSDTRKSDILNAATAAIRANSYSQECHRKGDDCLIRTMANERSVY